MIRDWGDLEVRGDAAAISDADLDAWTAETGRSIPSLVRDAIKRNGPGTLLGIYQVPAPSHHWEDWRARTNALRARGYWAGLDEACWSTLFVFGADPRGNFVAVGARERCWLLTSDGRALEAGHGVAEFLEVLPRLAASTFPGWDESALGIERCWIRGEPLREWLRSLEVEDEGDDGDALPNALSAEPLVIAYTHALASLAGPDGDAIPLPRRIDAADTLLRLVRRRQLSLFGTALPRELTKGDAITSPAVRTWACQPTIFDLPRLPPEAETNAYPVVEPLDDALRGQPRFGRVAATHTIEAWCSTWDAPSEHEVALALRARCLATAATPRFAITRLIGYLQYMPARVGLVVNGAVSPGWDGERDAVDIARRLESRQADAWPFVVLALRPLRYWVSNLLLPVLRGVREPEVAAMLLALVERPNFPLQGHQYAFEGESFYASQYADAYVEAFTPDDAVVDRFLPWLDRPSAATGMLEMGPVTVLAARADEDRVYDALLARFAKCPRVIAKAIAKRPIPRGVAVLKRHMRSSDLQTRFEVAHALVAIGDPEGPAALERCRAADKRI